MSGQELAWEAYTVGIRWLGGRGGDASALKVSFRCGPFYPSRLCCSMGGEVFITQWSPKEHFYYAVVAQELGISSAADNLPTGECTQKKQDKTRDVHFSTPD